jgi:DNA-binding transcriptional LysR family regulator
VHQGSHGKLTLGIHNSFANSHLPDVVKQFHQQFPAVRLEFREVTVMQEVELLKNQQLDVVFHRSPHPYQEAVGLDLSLRLGGLATLLSLVATGLGLSVMPSHTQILHRAGIVYRPIQGLDLCRYVTLLWRRDDASPVLRNFLTVLAVPNAV